MRDVLHILDKKGAYELFTHMQSHGEQNYNSLVNHMMSEKMVKSKTSANTVIISLTNLGLLDRIVTSSIPVRTRYRVSTNGHAVLGHLKNIEHVISSNNESYAQQSPVNAS